jgi:hypothetical protein
MFDVRTQSSPGYGKPTVQWTADGQAVNYPAIHDGVSNIWRQPINGSAPVQVTNFQDGRIFNFAYSPDAANLLFPKELSSAT